MSWCGFGQLLDSAGVLAVSFFLGGTALFVCLFVSWLVGWLVLVVLVVVVVVVERRFGVGLVFGCW